MAGISELSSEQVSHADLALVCGSGPHILSKGSDYHGLYLMEKPIQLATFPIRSSATMLNLCLSAGLAARNASVAQGRTGDGVKTEKEGVDFGKIIQSGLNGPLTEALASYYVVSERLALWPCPASVEYSTA